jgi:hypothetical protein
MFLSEYIVIVLYSDHHVSPSISVQGSEDMTSVCQRYRGNCSQPQDIAIGMQLSGLGVSIPVLFLTAVILLGRNMVEDGKEGRQGLSTAPSTQC